MPRLDFLMPDYLILRKEVYIDLDLSSFNTFSKSLFQITGLLVVFKFLGKILSLKIEKC